MLAERMYLPAFTDERGTLIAAELAEIPFQVQRVFTVSGPVGGATRGEHAVDCNELIVLQSGAVTIRLGPNEHTIDETVVLKRGGDAVFLRPGCFLAYDLPDEHASILVLAEAPYSVERAKR
ncbi:MAG: hypothetical protein EPN91_11605 [Salinibacterium sp.]|nr:MAG: hypothetical protein EPN91_11605 [Salinibacterium sp.]